MIGEQRMSARILATTTDIGTLLESFVRSWPINARLVSYVWVSLFHSEDLYSNDYLSFNAGQCDNNPGPRQAPNNCVRAQMFSNPTYTVNGRRIGNDQNNNARKIDESKSIVAGYFPFQETCQSDTDCTTSDACPLDCYLRPFALKTNLCSSSCFIREGLVRPGNVSVTLVDCSLTFLFNADV